MTENDSTNSENKKRFTIAYNENIEMVQYIDNEKEEPNRWAIWNARETAQKLNALHEENRELFQIIQNQSLIIQELHTKLMEYQLGKNPVIKLTKKDLEQCDKALSYYTHQKVKNE